MTVLREGVRLTALPVERLYGVHSQATRVGGLTVFLFFFVLNAALVGWCIVLARKERTPESADPSPSPKGDSREEVLRRR
jgi:hypothetical protein